MTLALNASLRLIEAFGTAVIIGGTFLLCIAAAIIFTMGVLDARTLTRDTASNRDRQ